MPERKFSNPGIAGKQAEGLSDELTTKAVGELDRSASKTSNAQRNLYNEMLDTSKQSLYPHQNENIAKFGGPWGHINNHSYGKTIKLAREADAYNNEPQDHMFHYGSFQGSGIKDLGIGYDRPKINTMETRAMDQAFQLDTQRKQLAQALQDAIDHKDLNAFMQAYQQLYGTEITRLQAENIMRHFTRQREISQLLTKDYDMFKAYFGRYITEDTTRAIWDLAKAQGNEQYASMLAQSINGTLPPTQADRLFNDTVQGLKTKYMQQGMSEFDAVNLATRQTNLALFENMNKMEYDLKYSQSLSERHNNKNEAAAERSSM